MKIILKLKEARKLKRRGKAQEMATPDFTPEIVQCTVCTQFGGLINITKKQFVTTQIVQCTQYDCRKTRTDHLLK